MLFKPDLKPDPQPDLNETAKAGKKPGASVARRSRRTPREKVDARNER